MSGNGEHFSIDLPEVLPHENMYLIQIGHKLFRLSGASLSSDSPSYFTNYFTRKNAERHGKGGGAVNGSGVLGQEDAAGAAGGGAGNGVMSPPLTISRGSFSGESGQEILFIDRSPEIFELIYNHLQGYCITIKDEYQYTMLFADAMYYNLPRLRNLLKNSDYYYTCIGGKSFKVPKNICNTQGNSPNYFDIAVDALYSDLEQVFLSRKLIRPPPQSPPYVPRSPALFKDILALLNGAEITMDDKKRNSLIKECRYYRFLNLEQKLFKCEIKYDPFYKREIITMLLKDLSSKGVDLTLKLTASHNNFACPVAARSPSGGAADAAAANKQQLQPPQNVQRLHEAQRESSSPPSATPQPPCKKPKLGSDWHICTYTRPYLNDPPRDLIFQISSMDCIMFFNKRKKTIHVNIRSEPAEKFISVFSGIFHRSHVDLNNYRDPVLLDGLIIPCCVSVCDLTLNGIKCTNICSLIDENKITEKIPDFTLGDGFVPGLKLVLMKSMWRLGVKDGEIILVCIRGEAITGINEFHHNISYL
ncbi:uncharacterized protein Ecym_4270 [Eremothecium cymbalariae DBVPG|uniref:BTB domain-containing protein n=1 Tax=Eremothecium cymbalariae (strain CBS 270.75 / DBVPG 7215 / KCTC 17166 / NRRL Y-17582) TaxID=931890 RepID=G8JTI1_ERECY|nr:hypothetical protein Ecym_4270 [Eremothecium cymbalariae DBVPG\